MPEIVLTTRRLSTRRRRRGAAVLGCGVAALAAGSLVLALAPITQGPGTIEAYLPPPATTDGSGGAVSLVERSRLRGPAPSVVSALASVPEDPEVGLVPAGLAPSANAPSGAAIDDPPQAPAQGTGSVPDEPDEPGEPGEPGEPPTRSAVTRLLDPAEQLLIQALGTIVPALVPLAEGVFESTGDLLEGVEKGLPFRLTRDSETP